MEAVLSNDDLVWLILQHAQLRPSTFVVASRVCKAWRAVCLRDASLLLKAVSECNYLTKTIVMGLFALTSGEANQLPRTVQPRMNGVMYRYAPCVALDALQMAGGAPGVRARLKKRARDQASIERAFGPRWRELQWPKRACGAS